MKGQSQKKMDPEEVFTKEEECDLYAYIEDMANLRMPLISTQVEIKVEWMTSDRMTPFKNRISCAL